MRIKKSVTNTVVAFASQVILILLGFVSRRVLIYSVGVQYLGINGLMTNILTIFSLAESGIGLAIGYSLYKPLAENDIEKIKSLMRFYKRTYQFLAVLTAGIGVAFYPFLPIFLKGNTAPDVTAIYFLFLFSSVVSYLWSYKVTLNSSDQNKYLYTIANTVTQIVVLIVKVFILYFTENYILYLTIDIGSTLIKNIIFSAILDRKYPYLKEKNVRKLDVDTKKKLFTNIKSLFFGKFGHIISQCSDNLVISSLVSINAVGMYSNYTTLITSVTGFVTTFSSGVIASMGNLIASESKERSYIVYKRIDFINFWLYTLTSIGLFCLIEPFIKIWLGKEYILSFEILVFAVLIYYLKGINSGIDIVKSASGLFYPDRYVSLIEAIINLIFSLILAMKYGLVGVLAGTLISFLVCSFWTKPYFVYRDVFNMSFRNYILWEGEKIVTSIIVTVLIYYFQSFVRMDNIFLELIVKTIIVITLANGMLVLRYFQSEEFGYIKGMMINVFSKLKARKKDTANKPPFGG